jgi:hypothetical protein
MRTPGRLQALNRRALRFVWSSWRTFRLGPIVNGMSRLCPPVCEPFFKRRAHVPHKDKDSREPASIDREIAGLDSPMRGRKEERSWRTHWYAGLKPKQYQPPKAVADAKVRTAVHNVELSKIEIAERPADTRTTGGRRT